MTNNNDRINEAIAILQTMNMEDCAQAIDNLRNELERVKGIAWRRLGRIAQLQHNLAVVEDKLEDTRSELKITADHLVAQRSLAGQLATELAQIEDDPRRLEDSDDDEIDASLARIRELDELGREPKSHLENELADLRASAFRSADAARYIVNYCR